MQDLTKIFLQQKIKWDVPWPVCMNENKMKIYKKFGSYIDVQYCGKWEGKEQTNKQSKAKHEHRK